MPLTERELRDLQADSMADDVQIDLELMRHWTAEQASDYFLSGGEVLPGAPKLMHDDQLRDGGHRGEEFARAISRLPPIGSGPPLFGENDPKMASRGCFEPKPAARMRLFVLYGVADVSMSSVQWIASAPDWLEVRLIDLPGHGFRATEKLPGCSQAATKFAPEVLVAERESLVRGIADEVAAAADGESVTRARPPPLPAAESAVTPLLPPSRRRQAVRALRLLVRSPCALRCR